MRDNWSTDTLLDTPVFKKYISQNRFQTGLKFVYLNDQSKCPPRKNDDGTNDDHNDSLYKVSPFYDAFLRNCKQTYTPNVNVAIDEAMISFRGRVGFWQSKKNEAVK